jgi:uncharacterized membrane protein (UPF0127 family)
MKYRELPIFGLGAVAGLLFLGFGCEKKPVSSPPMGVAQVKLRGQTFTVELAETREQRYTGLSGRTSLAECEGMLFIYPREQKLSFCMRDCEIPIDIAFLDRDLRVVNLYTMAVESDKTGRISYESHVPVQYALELPGGTLQRVGVAVGDQAEFIGVPPAEMAEPGQ